MMQPRLIKIHPERPESSAVQSTVDCLKKGGVIVYPTETVYGLGGDAANEQVFQRIQQLKNRNARSPFLILAGSQKEIEKYSHGSTGGLAGKLMDHFWPGPLTLILPASPEVPKWLLGCGTSVGIRLSSSVVCRALLTAFGGPLISTSANPSGLKPARSSAEAAGFFGDSVDLILDAGEMKSGMPSTVLDITGSVPVLIRRGAVSFDAIRDVAGTLKEA